MLLPKLAADCTILLCVLVIFAEWRPTVVLLRVAVVKAQ